MNETLSSTLKKLRLSGLAQTRRCFLCTRNRRQSGQMDRQDR